MTKRFLHVVTYFKDGDRHFDDLKPLFDKGLDWIRYAPNSWLVYTNSTPEKWYERLKPLFNSGDRLFIVEINLMERQGWLAKSTWKWINQDRSE